MNPMDQLKDIHLPTQVSAWPPAYGWWLLAIALLTLALFAAYKFYKFYQYRLAIRQATKILNNLDSAQTDWPAQLNSVLKRLVISYFPAKQVAALHGDDWVNFLCEQTHHHKNTNKLDAIRQLQHSLYDGCTQPPELDIVRNQARAWIKQALPPSRKTRAGVQPTDKEPGDV